jgi:pimeloyl-ACP methyl ester carboxylesterase
VEIPKTRYASSGEIAIAYQVHGEGEHDVLFSGSTASNIATVWDLPEAVRLFERLGRFARVIRYDRRDSGISDPIRDGLTIEAHAADALAVMDAVGAQRPVFLGGVDGSRSLAVLAATHRTNLDLESQLSLLSSREWSAPTIRPATARSRARSRCSARSGRS